MVDDINNNDDVPPTGLERLMHNIRRLTLEPGQVIDETLDLARAGVVRTMMPGEGIAMPGEGIAAAFAQNINVMAAPEEQGRVPVAPELDPNERNNIQGRNGRVAADAARGVRNNAPVEGQAQDTTVQVSGSGWTREAGPAGPFMGNEVSVQTTLDDGTVVTYFGTIKRDADGQATGQVTLGSFTTDRAPQLVRLDQPAIVDMNADNLNAIGRNENVTGNVGIDANTMQGLRNNVDQIQGARNMPPAAARLIGPAVDVGIDVTQPAGLAIGANGEVKKIGR